jgi:serine/threonine protein kinase
MRLWQQWVDPRVAAGDRWHSSRVGLTPSSCVLGDHLVSALRELARVADDDMSVARTGQFLQKKLRAFETERRLLLQLADAGRVIVLLQRTILSVLGVLGLLEAPVREIWERNLESERTEWGIEVAKVLTDEDKMKREMGDKTQQMQILALLRHELDQFGHILTSRELDLVARVFDVVAQRGNVVVGRLPTWFATSELEWFRAKTTIVEGGAAVCVSQAGIWAKLHHPNVRKFFGACHVGDAFVIHEACSPLPLPKQNVPRRRTRTARGGRTLDKKMRKREKRALHKAVQTWEYVLGCALGLQYVHDRGLVHERLSVGHLLYSQASQKGVLSGMGLLRRRRKQVGADPPDLHLGPSVESDVLAFGLATFEILVRDRPAEAAGSTDVVFTERMPDTRPGFITEAEWDLLADMCASDPEDRPCMADIVHEIGVLARPSPEHPTTGSVTTVTVDVRGYELQTLGMTLEATLEELEQLCDEASEASCSNVNRAVLDRLMDIYQQLLSSPELAATALVESFSLIVLRLFDLLDQNAWGAMSAAATMCASRTIAGKNYSLHHEIDSLLRTSDLQSTAPVHRWQKPWKEGWRRQDDKLASCMENPDALLNQLPSQVDRSEALALLQFESNAPLGTNPQKSSSFGDSEELPLWFIPPYQVQLGSHIADGAFGAVYEGEWLDTDVVVKQVLLEQTDLDSWAQFRREADLWFSLNHPNLIKLYGACHQGRPFFVCEPASHGTLASHLRGKSRRKVWFAIGDAALGLQHLHHHEIVHGDIKGNNILVCDSVDGLPTAKLADFGLSVVTNRAAPRVDDASGALGAFRWKAPECLQGMPPTFASDIYSFGMCLIEAITGRYPWGCTMPDSAVVRNVVENRLLPPRPESFSDEEWQLVTRMCHYEPQRRIPVGAVINCAFNLANHH